MANYPKAYTFFENEITLPLHTKLSDEEVGLYIETFKTSFWKSANFIKKNRKKSLDKEKNKVLK